MDVPSAVDSGRLIKKVSVYLDESGESVNVAYDYQARDGDTVWGGTTLATAGLDGANFVTMHNDMVESINDDTAPVAP